MNKILFLKRLAYLISDLDALNKTQNTQELKHPGINISIKNREI